MNSIIGKVILRDLTEITGLFSVCNVIFHNTLCEPLSGFKILRRYCLLRSLPCTVRGMCFRVV